MLNPQCTTLEETSVGCGEHGAARGEGGIDNAICGAVDANSRQSAKICEHGLIDGVVDGLSRKGDGEVESPAKITRAERGIASRPDSLEDEEKGDEGGQGCREQVKVRPLRCVK